MTPALSNNPTVSYLYGDDLISQSRAANDSFYIYDGLGSTRALSDETGAVTDTYDYSAYGTLINNTGSTENAYRYTGEQSDGGLDQYYLRARYYDQGIGRFTSMDTYQGRMLEPVTLHKYMYGNGDPVNNVDPSGNVTLSNILKSIAVVGILTTSSIGTYDYFTVGRHHEYDVESFICSQDSQTRSKCNSMVIYDALRRFPAPYIGKAYYPVNNGEKSVVPLLGPVEHVLLPNTVVNITLEKHKLYPGYVKRSVVQKGNSFYISTYGEGVGRAAWANEWFSEYLWKGTDKSIINYLESGGGL